MRGPADFSRHDCLLAFDSRSWSGSSAQAGVRAEANSGIAANERGPSMKRENGLLRARWLVL